MMELREDDESEEIIESFDLEDDEEDEAGLLSQSNESGSVDKFKFSLLSEKKKPAE